MDDSFRYVTPQHVDPKRARSHALAYRPTYIEGGAVTLCHSDRVLRRFTISDAPTAPICKRCARLQEGAQ
jgi:hypothetical protein